MLAFMACLIPSQSLSAQNAMLDSVRRVEMKARIDSLRTVTPGMPLVIDEDTLFVLYSRFGGILPQIRVERARQEILTQGRRLTFFTDSIYVYESEFTSDVMAGDHLVLSITDIDALWQEMPRQELANQYASIIEAKIREIHEDYGLKQKLLGLLMMVIIVALQWLCIKLTNWLYRRWKFRLTRLVMRRAIPLVIKDYEVLNVHRMGMLFLMLYRLLRIAIIVMQLMITIPVLFSLFPETKSFLMTILGYIWDPTTDIFWGVIGYLPKFFKILVIIICFRYLVKGLHYLSNEIASGHLKINGFYPDLAEPTYNILRVLCYSFMIVMIWPLLPNSNSEVFQGVSVFLGVIVSLGSTSIIGNMMSGLVMTYMRPFRTGDFIRFGEVEGFVVEKTALVTRIRTRKNEIITIPNSTLMSAQTSNFTSAAHNYGIIVHTKVTIGYDMKHELIEDLLLSAARATRHIEKKPLPFVRVTKLDDFYVEYEINAYTRHSESLSEIYSELHQHILDHFHSSGVEIMSPHIFGLRNDLELQIPKSENK